MRRTHIFLVLTFILIICMVNSRMHLGKKIKKLGSDVKDTAKKVGKKAEHTAHDVSDKVGDFLGDSEKKVEHSIKELINTIKKKLGIKIEKAKEEHGGKVPEDVKQDLLEEAIQEFEVGYNKIIKEYSNLGVPLSLPDEVEDTIEEIFDEYSLPEYLKEWEDELKKPDFDTENWNMPKEVRSSLKEFYKGGEGFKQTIKNEFKNIVDLQVQNPNLTDEEVDKMVQKATKKFKNEIFNDKNTGKLISEINEKANELKDELEYQLEEIEFEIEDFRDEVRDIVDDMEDEYYEISLDERSELIDLVLTTNEKLNDLLEEITDPNTRERVIKRFKNEVHQELSSHSTSTSSSTPSNFDSISKNIDSKVDKIKDPELRYREGDSIKLEAPYVLKPKQQFTFSLQDITTSPIYDVDFFEFVSMELEDRIYTKDGQEEGYVYVTPDAIHSIAPSGSKKYYTSLGNSYYGYVYKYNTTLKYTPLSSDEPFLVQTWFKLTVSEDADAVNSQGYLSRRFLIGLCLVFTAFVSIFVTLGCYRKWKRSKIIKYVSDDPTGGIQYAQNDSSRNSDLEIS